MTTKQKTQELKAVGAQYTKNVGWAFPDPNTGTCWFDNSSYNGTQFLGANADDAYEALHEQDGRD